MLNLGGWASEEFDAHVITMQHRYMRVDFSQAYGSCRFSRPQESAMIGMETVATIWGQTIFLVMGVWAAEEEHHAILSVCLRVVYCTLRWEVRAVDGIPQLLYTYV